MDVLTPKQMQILRTLYAQGASMSPTGMGMACGQPYRKASSWASSGIKALVEKGYVRRAPGSTYELTKAGKMVGEEVAGE